MKRARQKSNEYGSGFVAVRNSDHHGIAGYYAMMALEHDYMGMSMTGADVVVVPPSCTGRDAGQQSHRRGSPCKFGVAVCYEYGHQRRQSWALEAAGA